jgi:lipase maturation factor 1
MGAPGWCAPHQPRLDWQMWFAALESPEQNRWLVGLVVRLFQNNPDVIHLLKNNPFSDLPPRYIRAEFYRYRFSTIEEHRATGAWWKRQLLGEYFHEISSERLGLATGRVRPTGGPDRQ